LNEPDRQARITGQEPVLDRPARGTSFMPDSLLAVVPVLVGPLQVLLALLPAILVAILTTALSLLKPRAMKALCRVLWRLKVQVVVTAALVAALVFAVRAIQPGGGTIQEASGGAQDWTMFRGGPSRRGAAVDAVAPTGGGVNWVWRDEGEAFYSSPAVVGNRVYIASASVGAFSQSGAIYCFDAGTGTVVWRAEPQGFRPTFSSPAISGRFLVCGEGLHETRDARVVCLDLREGETAGRVLWALRTSSHVECAPVIAGGRVYVGAGDDGYYCVELEPAADGSPRVVWHAPGERFADAETSLLVVGDRLWAGLGVGGRAICLLDAGSGEELRRVETPYPVFSPPALAGGRIFVGMGNGDLVNSAEDARDLRLEVLREKGAGEAELARLERTLAPGGAVWCLDARTLERIWSVEVPRTVLGAVAVLEDRIYFGSRDGRIRCVGTDGRALGEWDAGAPVVASPVVTSEHVVLMTISGRLFVLDRVALEPVWDMAVASGPLAISSPALGGGRVIVGTQRDGLVCVGSHAAQKPTPIWPGALGGAGEAGCVDGSAIPSGGEVAWRFPPQGDDRRLDVTAPPALLDGRLLAPCVDDTGAGVVALATDPDPSTRRWLWRFSTRNTVHRSAAAVGDRVVVVDGRRGDAQRRLASVDLDTGKALWSVEVDSDASGAFVVTLDSIICETSPGLLRCLDPGGGARWTKDVGRLDVEPTVTDSMLLLATREPGALVALDRDTGIELWSAPLTDAVEGRPVVVAARVLVGTSRGLESRSLLDGRLVDGWTAGGGPVTADLARVAKSIVFVDADGRLVRVATRSGATVVRDLEGLAASTPLAGRDSVLLSAQHGLVRLVVDRADADPELWASVEETGRLSTPPVLADSRVYVGVAGRGIVCLRASE